MVGMTLGTGVGGGIVIDGRVFRGASETAGEIGHITVVPDGPPCGCGNRGCLEAIVGTVGLLSRTQEAVRAADRAIGKNAQGVREKFSEFESYTGPNTQLETESAKLVRKSLRTFAQQVCML